MLVGEEPKLYKQIMMGNCKKPNVIYTPGWMTGIKEPFPLEVIDNSLNRAICLDISAIQPNVEFIELKAPFKTIWVEYDEILLLPKNNEIHKYKCRFGQLVISAEKNTLVMVWFYMQIHNHSPYGPIGGWLYRLDDKGNFLRGQSFQQNPSDDDLKGILRARSYLFSALRFMNCKNVLFVEQHFTGKIKKLKRRKPDYRYYSLKINNMRKTSNSKKDVGRIGARELPLHIVRGHYKRYEDKGLFNKIFGTFWWGSMYRGSQGNGVIGKDYLLEE